MFLSDHAGNIAAAWYSAPAHHHRHDGVAPPHAADNVESGLIFAHDGEVSTGNLPQTDAGVCTLQPAPKACIDPNYPVDVTLFSDHDVSQAPCVLRLTQVFVETVFRW